ncbi:MAG: STAS domain-containing protein [Ruminiclostridium sp.]|nr:STAS domain-containing protein [Ruminiclostridium sp.]
MTTSRENDTLRISVSGRIDTSNAPDLEKGIKQEIADAKTLLLDFSKVDYISSSGLRVLLSVNKVMSTSGGELIIKDPTDMVFEVFDVTGFSDILNIER